jgi:hypothetical protein
MAYTVEKILGTWVTVSSSSRTGEARYYREYGV